MNRPCVAVNGQQFDTKWFTIKLIVFSYYSQPGPIFESEQKKEVKPFLFRSDSFSGLNSNYYCGYQ